MVDEPQLVPIMVRFLHNSKVPVETDGSSVVVDPDDQHAPLAVEETRNGLGRYEFDSVIPSTCVEVHPGR